MNEVNQERSEDLKKLDWYQELLHTAVYIYPQLASDGKTIQPEKFYPSVQCPGCFQILKPNDDAKAWIFLHYEHKDEIRPFYYVTDEQREAVSLISLM